MPPGMTFSKPWVLLPASYVPPPQGMSAWGLPHPHDIGPCEQFGTWKEILPVKELQDASRLVEGMLWAMRRNRA